MVGFGLWDSFAGTVILEGVLFLGGIFIYLKTTKAKNKTGQFAFWGLITFLVLINIGNLTSPPPSDVTILAWAGHLQWLIVIWAYWIDKNRTEKAVPESPKELKLVQ